MPFDFSKISLKKPIFETPEVGVTTDIPTQLPPSSISPPRSEIPFGTLKEGSVFPTPQINAPPPQQMEVDPVDEVMEIYNRIVTPDTAMRDRMTGMLDTMPVRQEPNIWRRLGSIMPGIAHGPEAQQQFKYAPYNRQMADWKEKFDPTHKAAQVEGSANTYERMLAHQTAQSAVAARRAKSGEDRERRLQQGLEDKIKNEALKRENEKFKRENPDWDLEKSADGNYYWVPPRPDLGNPKNTGLKHGDLTDLEEWNFRKQIAHIRGAEQRKTQQSRRDDPMDPRNYQIVTDYDADTGVPVQSYRVHKGTGAASPITGPGGKPIITNRGWTPDQTNDQVIQRAYKLKRSKPDLGQWIEWDQYGGVTIRDDTPERERGLIENELTGPTPTRRNQGEPANTPPKGTKPAAPTGGYYRTLPDGTKVYVKESTVKPVPSH